MKITLGIAALKRSLERRVRRVCARWGYVLLPIAEIERMEENAAHDYEAMPKIAEAELRGYFNGMADYGSKLAFNFRKRYSPNGCKLSDDSCGLKTSQAEPASPA